MNYKTCKKCQNNLRIIKFRVRKKNNKHYNICKQCENINNKLYNKNHRSDKKLYAKQYQQNNPTYKANWRSKNKLVINNKEKLKKQIDVSYKLRKNVSRSISKAINKKSNSITKYLPYTLDDLKNHLESLFEPWMTWTNYGQYKKTSWKDEDSSTWKWNIDHIIPQSTFQYSNMEDQSFKDCWNLDNLRPYSAKLNVLDGAQKIRHTFIDKME